MEASGNLQSSSENILQPSHINEHVAHKSEDLSTTGSNNFWIDHRYNVLQLLGEGAFGSVFLVYDNIDLHLRALKMASSQQTEQALKTEISIMQKLTTSEVMQDQPILHLLDSNIDQGVIVTDENEIVNTDLSYFITEFAENGDLGSHIINNNRAFKKGQPECQIFEMFRQLVDGVEAMHNKGFVHLDLKPDNVLLNIHSQIMISDFALSRPIKGEDGKGNFRKYKAGSPWYWSPEMYTSSPYNGVQSDLYALGIILFVLTFGSWPFKHANLDDVNFRLLFTNPVEFWKSHPDTSRRIDQNTVSQELIKLLNCMLCPLPQFRLSISEIRKSDWYTKNIEPKLLNEKEQKCWKAMDFEDITTDKYLETNLTTMNEYSEYT